MLILTKYLLKNIKAAANSEVLRQWGWTQSVRHLLYYYQQLSQLNIYYLASVHILYFSFSIGLSSPGATFIKYPTDRKALPLVAINSKISMNEFYPFRHWIVTLLLTPFISIGYELILGQPKSQVVGLLEFFPLTFTFGLMFSLPAFGCYYIAFYYLKRQNVPLKTAKLVLIIFSVISIIFTFSFIGGSLSILYAFFYSIASIIAGLLFSLKKKEPTLDI